IFKEHRLTLAIRPDDEIVETQGKFDDGIEAGERPVARPHLLDEDAAVTRAEQVHHASGQDRRSKPVRRLLDGRLLAFDRGEQFAAVMEVIGAWAHRASSLTGTFRMENHEWTRTDTNGTDKDFTD